MNEMIIRTSGHVSGGKTNREAALYAPYIDPNTNTWWQYNKETQMFEDTGAVPYGLKGEKGDPGDNYVLTPEDIEYILEDLRSQIVVNSDTVNGHTVQSDVPVGAVFTDTTYSNASASSDGLMSAADKQAVDALGNAANLNFTEAVSFVSGTRIQFKNGSENLSPIAMFTGGNLIATNTDLNTLTNPGFYCCTSAAAAETLTNCPTTANFVMYVGYKGTYTNQIIYTGSGIFARAGGSTGMGEWYEFSGRIAEDPPVVTAAWTATSTNASLANVTETVTLRSGTWLAVGSTPVSDNANMSYTLRSTSGTTTLGSNRWFKNGLDSYCPINIIFSVSSTTANVVLRTGGSALTNYSYTERGHLEFVKLDRA